MSITKKVTNDPKLAFIGTHSDEEYYLKLDDDSARGWSFMGLRPETEETLRERARESDPEDYLGISRADFANIQQYFDYDKFSDDMEEDWLDRHDSQAERENENGETLYLGFGSGQSIFGYFKEHNIHDYESYENHFDEIGLTEAQFNTLNEIVKRDIGRDTSIAGKELLTKERDEIANVFK